MYGTCRGLCPMAFSRTQPRDVCKAVPLSPHLLACCASPRISLEQTMIGTSLGLGVYSHRQQHVLQWSQRIRRGRWSRCSRVASIFKRNETGEITTNNTNTDLHHLLPNDQEVLMHPSSGRMPLKSPTRR